MDDLQTINYDRTFATGIDVANIIGNLNALHDAVEDLEKDHGAEINRLWRVAGFGSFSAAFDTKGVHTLFEAGTHTDLRIKYAYATLGDNSPEEVTIRLLKMGTKAVAEPLTLKSTEKRGKVQIFELNEHEIIGQHDSLEVEISSNRRVTINISFVHLEVA